MAKPKLLVIGLDSTPSNLLFKDMAQELPNIKKMMDNGIFATLESCHPPITVPAWMVMMSSKTPGKLGIYGFRHRKGFSYNEGWLANSQTMREPKIWDFLSQQDKKVCLVGVPLTYPPVPVNGCLVSCFLTPKGNKGFTYPPELAEEIDKITDGKYLFDVAFRTDDRDMILDKIYQMTENRFKVVKHLMSTKEWDYLMFVEIGVDRLHHMFWKYYDKSHPRYTAHDTYSKAIPEYYKYLDGKIGELLAMVDNDTYVLVVSDHGTASMKGAFCINEWLIKEGYLVLKKYPDSITDFDKCEVDWEKTTAWGWGGYHGRIFLNIKGREANGQIPMNKYNEFRDTMRSRLSNIMGPQGEKFDNKIFYPEELYEYSNGSKPDIMVYFDNLFWRSAGTIGHKRL